MLQLIVFACGAALMGLEFLAARMLAPTLGSSLFVWGSVISIVMVALSLGYWLGGRIADRFGSTRTLGPVITFAGLFTVIIPGLSALVLPSLAGLGARTGSLVASAIVFFVPSLLLAMVSPLGVRLAARSGVEHVGSSAGTLYAISTAGSIAGTIATAFWLIPLLSLDGLVIAIGLTLFATGALATTLPRRYAEPAIPATSGRIAGLLRIATVAALVLGIIVSTATLWVPADPSLPILSGERVLYRKDTQYHRLYVTEDDFERHLRFDRSHQSSMNLDDPFDSSIAYTDYLHLPLAIQPDADRVLIVGLGGGTAVKRYWRDYPGMQVDVVELDPIVVDVAYGYFELPRDPRISVTTEDGRRFLQATTEKYDIIILDAYYADSLPSHLVTEEFFRVVDEHLEPGGVVAYNVIGALEGSDSRLFRSMYRTASRVWDRLWVFPVDYSGPESDTQRRNIIVMGTDDALTEDEFRGRIESRLDSRITVPDFDTFAGDLYTEPVATDDVPVLTDQHAPTDSLIEVQ